MTLYFLEANGNVFNIFGATKKSYFFLRSIKEKFHEQRYKLFLFNNFVSLILHATPKEKRAQNSRSFASNKWHSSWKSWFLSDKEWISICWAGRHRITKEDIPSLKAGGTTGCRTENSREVIRRNLKLSITKDDVLVTNLCITHYSKQ